VTLLLPFYPHHQTREDNMSSTTEQQAPSSLVPPITIEIPETHLETVMSSAIDTPPSPEGPGSVSGAPNLADGFTDTFTSRYVDTGDLRQHVVTGGTGPPLLRMHGWPQTW
jgi:hypothetical protein